MCVKTVLLYANLYNQEGKTHFKSKQAIAINVRNMFLLQINIIKRLNMLINTKII